jgi:DNA-binding response OmpR family regulator
LVIDESPAVSHQLSKALQEQGYVVDVTRSGREGEARAAANGYDGIISDVLLPDHDGFQICRNLRRRKVATPFLFLSTLTATSDKVAGLESGADDYVTKPFDLEELMARVRALVRRGKPEDGATLHFADVELNLLKRIATRAGRPIGLTSKEFALLEYFMRNPNRVLSRSLIGERVWDIAFEDQSNVIEVYVSRLRSKIDKGFDKPLIHTLIGAGYMMSEEPAAA